MKNKTNECSKLRSCKIDDMAMNDMLIAYISKSGKKLPAIVVPTIHCRSFGTIMLGSQ